MPFLKETKVKLVDFSSHSVRFTGHSHKSDYEMILGLEGRSYMTPLKEKLSLVSGGFGQLEDEFYFTWTMGLLERIIMNQSWTHSLTVPADGGFEMKMRRLMELYYEELFDQARAMLAGEPA